MCLNADRKTTDKLLNSKKETIDIYKVYEVDKKNQKLRSIIMSQHEINNFGVVKSTRESKDLTPLETNYLPPGGEIFAVINQGIHVCLTLSRAKTWRDCDDEKIIKCKAKIQHLVAAGFDEAVFTEIEIPETEWKKVFKIKQKK